MDRQVEDLKEVLQTRGSNPLWKFLKESLQEMLDKAVQEVLSPAKSVEELRLWQGQYRALRWVLSLPENVLKGLEKEAELVARRTAENG
jgi:hypothetical protein